ncbi:flagellar protein FlaG [Pseudomonas umsongensis]|jgi:flagellar protein FlaG|uniref:flagellar protein FlaG n=1 Tax=Pseudomonas umsongensis TaxID=198618 RepID=UPI0015BF616A|nr:flagellar protein FlaG [Pseudomonas umsongensis]NWL21822.1 flagellar biosynthesis protein FlaG [Pseudomonas umsongensis]
MDMSVKLNQSYPAVAPQTAPVVIDPVQQPKVEAVASSATEPKREELEQAVTDIREFVQAGQRQLDFSIDDSTGRVVVKVIATESGDVIRQIPSETALKLAQSLSQASSLLFDDKV